jgi:hypothetical protein
MNVEIPRLNSHEDPGPGWIAVSSEGRPLKPLIKCNCGKVCGIGLHHVHADGTVTASFYHSEASEFTEGGRTYRHTPGCGWHVFLKLKDYDRGDFPPGAE